MKASKSLKKTLSTRTSILHQMGHYTSSILKERTTMDNDKIRQLWLDDDFEEVPIPESSLPKKLQGQNAHLILRSLDADTAGDILDACTDKTGKTIQKK